MRTRGQPCDQSARLTRSAVAWGCPERIDKTNGCQYLKMLDDEFEWEAAINERDHGISFEMARAAFRHAFSIERVDLGRDDPEERFALLGMVEDRLLFVYYTLRGERIRIISARKAEPHERRRYDNENREV